MRANADDGLYMYIWVCIKYTDRHEPKFELNSGAEGEEKKKG